MYESYRFRRWIPGKFGHNRVAVHRLSRWLVWRLPRASRAAGRCL